MTHGKVEVWYMSPEELEAYKAKYPIKSKKSPKGTSFVNKDGEFSRGSKKKDYKWRGQKAADSRWGNYEKPNS